jgi:hypothetical protein
MLKTDQNARQARISEKWKKNANKTVLRLRQASMDDVNGL